MFNFIVKAGEWDDDGRDEILASRLFEHPDDDLAAMFVRDERPDFNKLKALPTLFVQEGVEDEIARLGTIDEVAENGKMLVLRYRYDHGVSIKNRTLAAARADFGIREWELERTHWAVKRGDLCRLLLRQRPARRVGPKVFQIAEHETIERDLVSVMMPFAAQYDAVYANLQGLCADLSKRCLRGDDIWDHEQVMQDVASLIDRSQVVIADCTGRNPNVFYEIGIAHTLGRNVILISQSVDDVPFDLRHLRFVVYLNNGEGLRKLQQDLRQRLLDLL